MARCGTHRVASDGSDTSKRDMAVILIFPAISLFWRYAAEIAVIVSQNGKFDQPEQSAASNKPAMYATGRNRLSICSVSASRAHATIVHPRSQPHATPLTS